MAEVGNYLKKKGYIRPAIEVIKMFNTNEKIDVYFNDEIMSEQACGFFYRVDRLSYVDASTIAFYLQLNCDYLISFDSDFDGINKKIRRLEDTP